jgi:hypothetical protein
MGSEDMTVGSTSTLCHWLWIVALALPACSRSERAPADTSSAANSDRMAATLPSASAGRTIDGPAPVTGGGNAGQGGSAQNDQDSLSSGGTSGASALGASGRGADGRLERFSFFVTSLQAMRELSGSQHGFGGDLRFGETGENAGLRGADKICTTIAEKSMPGSGEKQWRAFLSTTKGGPDGEAVNAIDRVGEGPWYDRLGRVFSNKKADLMQIRPASADPAIKDDLPNEDGVPNHNPDGVGEVDNHDFLTGTDVNGQLYADDPHVTCNDWTKSFPDAADAPRAGHTWPRTFMDLDTDGENWVSALNESGCGAEVSVIEQGPPEEQGTTVGSGGGYGGIYCFALTP